MIMISETTISASITTSCDIRTRTSDIDSEIMIGGGVNIGGVVR
jgi:hypothetical protein